MSKKKISKEQVDALFDFMQRKRVRYYDLQVELVDHFASAIEALWADDPDLPFERAINKVYDGFPITGFSAVIDKQTEAIQKEAWRWVYRAWIDYFRWPRILLSLSLVFAVRLLFLLPIETYWLYWAFMLSLLSGGIYLFYLTKTTAKTTGKRFLRLEATYSAVSLGLNFIYPVLIFSQNLFLGEFSSWPAWASWTIAFLSVYSGFLFYILFYRLPQRALADLQRHFPKYV